MALRNIRTNDDPILRKNSRKVEEIDRRTQILIDDMFDTMYDAGGVGLAAVQVGVLKQVIVIDTDQPGERLVLINPEIIDNLIEYPKVIDKFQDNSIFCSCYLVGFGTLSFQIG